MRGGVEVPGGGLPVGDAQHRFRTVLARGDVHRACRQRPVVQGAVVGVPDGLGELAHQVQTHCGREPVAVRVQVRVEPQVRLSVPEQDRRAALVLAELHGLDDAAVVDALQHLVLAQSCPVHPAALLRRRLLARQIDPDPAVLLDQAIVAYGEPVLPARARVQRTRREPPVVPEPQVGGGVADADALHQHFEPLTVLRGDAPALPLRRQPEETVPDARQTARAAVASVDRGPLELVQLAHEVGIMQEDRWLDEGDLRLGDPCRTRGTLELGLELLGLEIGEVQRVAQRPHPVVVELPGVPVVHHSARVSLELQQVDATGYGNQQIALVDPARDASEPERRPRPVRLSGRHQLPYVLKALLLPLETGPARLEPVLATRWRAGLGSGRRHLRVLRHRAAW